MGMPSGFESNIMAAMMGSSSSKTISTEEAQQWKEEGYSVSRDLFVGSPLIEECVTFLDSYYAKYNGQWPADFGSPNNDLEFPTATILDQLVYHPSILNSVEELLGTADFILSQGDTWGKLNTASEVPRENSGEEVEEGDAAAKIDDKAYNNNNNNNGGEHIAIDTIGGSNQDQRMHMDYGNHTFVHPPPWNCPEAVTIIIYLSNTSETGGGTAVVPKNIETDDLGLYEYPYGNMPGIGSLPFHNNKQHAEAMMATLSPEMKIFRENLYQNEIIGSFNVGDVLWYRLDTWHRGTPTVPNKTRYVMNLVFKKRAAMHIHSWNGMMGVKLYSGKLNEAVIQLSPSQRAQVFAIPVLEDAYWNQETIKAFAMRFPGIDVQPYEEAYHKRGQ